MARIVLKNKTIQVNLFEIILMLLLLFVTLSAGTQWGHLYRATAISCIGIICIAAIIVRGRVYLDSKNVIYLGYIIYLFGVVYFSFSQRASMRWAILNGSLLLLLFFNLKTSFWDRFVRVCYIYSIIMAISVIVSVISPSGFVQLFWWFLGPTRTFSEGFLIRALAGQYAGLAREIAEAAVICNYGIAIVYSKIFSQGKAKGNQLVALFFLFIGLILTTKRTLFVIPIFLLLIIVLLTQQDITKKIKWLIMLAVFACLILLLMFSVPQLSTIVERFGDTENYENMGGREVLWDISKKMFEENKLVGMGYNTYNAYAQTTEFGRKNNWSTYGHNIYLQLLAEGGIIGFVIVMSILIIPLIKTLRLLKKNTKYKQQLVFCLYVQMMFFIYGLTGNVLSYWQQIAMWFVVIAYVLSIERMSGGLHEKDRNINVS